MAGTAYNRVVEQAFQKMEQVFRGMEQVTEHRGELFDWQMAHV